MKERPILYSGPMVRAVLAGIKTQTRRMPRGGLWGSQEPNDGHPLIFDKTVGRWVRVEAQDCPYGVPGDRLWVREAFGMSYDGSAIPWTGADPQRDGKVIYRATFGDEKPDEGRLPWKPSIHMPRWASRITLEVTGVRVERLDDISDADAVAEGIQGFAQPRGRTTKWGIPEWNQHRLERSPREAYFQLLSDIHGDEGPNRRSWLWVTSFKVLSEGAI